MADLQAAEEAASSIAAELGERAATEREREAAAEAARSAVTELRLRDTRLSGDLEAVGRDRDRLIGERDASIASLAAQRRSLAAPVPARDVELEGAVAEADRLLAEATAELASLRAAGRARGEEAAALRRAEAAREAEAETARRRLAETTRRLDAERAETDAATGRHDELERRHAAARDDAAAANGALERAIGEREAGRSAADAADARRRSAEERSAAATAALAAANARLAGLEERLREDEARGIARAARRHGGRRVDEELQVDPALRAAVEATLDELARAYVVDAGAATGMAGERGHLVVKERAADRPASDAAATRRFLDRLSDAGGSVLADGVRRDASGSVGSLLARAAAVADLATALELQPSLPPGWTIATRDGSALVTELTVRLGRGDAPLERRAEADRVRAEVARLTADAESAGAAARDAAAASDAARQGANVADASEARLAADRRRADETERSAARELEAAAREAGWHAAQVDRLAADAQRAREAVEALRSAGTDGAAAPVLDPDRGDRGAIAEWEARAADLRARRDRLGSDLAAVDAVRREAETGRARAEATVAMEESRIARSETDLAALAERSDRLAVDRAAVGRDLASATDRAERAAAALAEVRAADSADRERLTAAERAASNARDRLRSADDRLRAADRADLEARLGRDALREQLLVELAGLGELGRRHLEDAAGVRPVAMGPGRPETIDRDEGQVPESPEIDDAEALEAALDAAASRWAGEAPPTEAPSTGRLATLRRRYHELGAANPFAVEEYDELRRRLETLETQREDLRAAIDKTRRLIADLNDMIATQFRATFAALETAFDGRFQQLFGGGFARLSLTDPEDLASTGVEIVARPPGKKAQALAMLSGGERALTAVALLFAMLEIRPVPFCVLDEVDAALDEANVGRFSDALRGLAERTQFIVITHNRGTIEAADALYGVTVGDDSVSRVISLRLDEARAIADRQRGERLASAEQNGTVGAPAIDELAEVG
jgi:chromosome segregation protein